MAQTPGMSPPPPDKKTMEHPPMAHNILHIVTLYYGSMAYTIYYGTTAQTINFRTKKCFIERKSWLVLVN